MVLTWEYGLEYRHIIRGNHARQQRSSSLKRQQFALFFLKTFLIQVFFRYNKAIIYPPLGEFGEILPSMMIFPSDLNT